MLQFFYLTLQLLSPSKNYFANSRCVSGNSMKQLFALFFFFVIAKCSFGSCATEWRTLTERLFNNQIGTVFSCKILSAGTTESENNLSTAEIIQVYFGIVDSNIITLRTGSHNSSEGGTILPVGKTYLVYSRGRGNVFGCCDICDQMTKQVTDNPDSTFEVRLIKQFSNIFLQKTSGYFTFKNPKGIAIAEGKFKKGNPINVWKHYYDNGKIKSIHDLDSNIVSEYSTLGLITYKSTIKNNVGIYEQFSSVVNGRLKSIDIETNNDTSLVMQEYLYYDNGNLKNTYTQLNIKRNGDLAGAGRIGTYEEYYENGKLKLKGQYHLGQKTGNWKWFKENGEFDKEVDYKN